MTQAGRDARYTPIVFVHAVVFQVQLVDVIAVLAVRSAFCREVNVASVGAEIQMLISRLTSPKMNLPETRKRVITGESQLSNGI